MQTVGRTMIVLFRKKKVWFYVIIIVLGIISIKILNRRTRVRGQVFVHIV